MWTLTAWQYYEYLHCTITTSRKRWRYNVYNEGQCAAVDRQYTAEAPRRSGEWEFFFISKPCMVYQWITPSSACCPSTPLQYIAEPLNQRNVNNPTDAWMWFECRHFYQKKEKQTKSLIHCLSTENLIQSCALNHTKKHLSDEQIHSVQIATDCIICFFF